MREKAIFLDRDGTLIEDIGYVSDPKDLKILPSVISALKKFRSENWKLVIITNQSGIGRGYYCKNDFFAFHSQFDHELAKNDLAVDGIYYCPHTPEDNCQCRKPKIGLFEQASLDMNIALPLSWMIGDKLSDIEAGLNAGCKAILLSSVQGTNELYYSKPDLLSAAHFILGQ